MSEPDISTLARRLAEQNNVDWRALSGSGPEGKVVERDVLDFLARVMAGAEATDPTPEPLPDGMEAWPDKDLHEVRAGVAESATLGDLRQELADSVRPEEAPEASEGAHGSEPYGQVESVRFGAAQDLSGGVEDDQVVVGEDIFLFDDEGNDDTGGRADGGADGFTTVAAGTAEGAAPAVDTALGHTASDVDGADDLVDLLVAGDEFEDAGEAGLGEQGGEGLGDGLGAHAGSGLEASGHDDLSTSFGGLTAGEFGEPPEDHLGGQLHADEHDDRDDTEGAHAAGSSNDFAAPGSGDALWSQPLAGSGSAGSSDVSELGAFQDASEDASQHTTQDGGAATGTDWGSDIALGRDRSAAFGSTGAEDGGLWGEPESQSVSDDDLWAKDDESVAEPFEAGADDGHSTKDIDPWTSPSSGSGSPFASDDGDASTKPGSGAGDWRADDTAADDTAADHTAAYETAAHDRAGDSVHHDQQVESRDQGEQGDHRDLGDHGDYGDHGHHGDSDGHGDRADHGLATEVGTATKDTGLDHTPVAPNTAELPLARSATILRRHIDLSALAASQLSVGNELGFDEPLGVAPFLLRAVAKAAGEIDVSSSHVAMAVLDKGLELRRVSDAAQRSFASLVAELAEPTVIEDEPRLVAADLSGLDLDEVVLDLDIPVVTLGRILYDNQRGAYRSTLALSGANQPEAGARLLARVAELLDAPVRLVL